MSSIRLLRGRGISTRCTSFENRRDYILGKKKSALSFECVRGWFQIFCLSRCARLPSLQLMKACTWHLAWRRFLCYGTSPLKTQGKLVSDLFSYLGKSIAQVFNCARSYRETRRLLAIINALECVFLLFTQTFCDGNSSTEISKVS
jgi:hypothetical protein